MCLNPTWVKWIRHQDRALARMGLNQSGHRPEWVNPVRFKGKGHYIFTVWLLLYHRAARIQLTVRECFTASLCHTHHPYNRSYGPSLLLNKNFILSSFPSFLVLASFSKSKQSIALAVLSRQRREITAHSPSPRRPLHRRTTSYAEISRCLHKRSRERWVLVVGTAEGRGEQAVRNRAGSEKYRSMKLLGFEEGTRRGERRSEQ